MYYFDYGASLGPYIHTHTSKSTKDTNLKVLVGKLLKSTKCLLERCIHPHRRRDLMTYCDPFCGVSSAYHITVGEEKPFGSEQAVDLLDLSLRPSDGVGARVC